jgi:hypothetical protein
MTDERRAAEQKALEQAVAITYFFIAMSGASIAFVMQNDVLERIDTLFSRMLVSVAVISFFVSCACGIVVCMRAPVLTRWGKENLDDRWLKTFGGLNILLFVFGILLLSLFALGLLWQPANPSTC